LEYLQSYGVLAQACVIVSPAVVVVISRKFPNA